MLLAAGGGAVAGALIGTGVGLAAGVSAAEATTATIAVTGGSEAANTVCGGDACSSEIQDTIPIVQRAGELIFRNASGTPDSLTPRLAKDVMGPIAEGKTPGLSFWNSLDKLNPGKYVTVDTSKLNSLDVIFDNDPVGHVTVTTDIGTLTQWANTRGLATVMENAHKLTQEIWNAAGRIVQSK